MKINLTISDAPIKDRRAYAKDISYIGEMFKLFSEKHKDEKITAIEMYVEMESGDSFGADTDEIN